MRILAPVGCYERQRCRVHRFPVSARSWAPGCKTVGASYPYSEGAGPPPRKGLQNLGAQEVWGTTSTRTGRLHSSLYHL